MLTQGGLTELHGQVYHSTTPDFGKSKHNPSRDVYKTKADVVKLIQQAVADGASLIQQRGDAGLDKIAKYARGNRLVHNSYTWTLAIEHGAEHCSNRAQARVPVLLARYR
jgi:hypothetical protein